MSTNQRIRKTANANRRRRRWVATINLIRRRIWRHMTAEKEGCITAQCMKSAKGINKKEER